MAAEKGEPQKAGLKRDLTKLESYATIIGILVGTGIFVSDIAQHEKLPAGERGLTAWQLLLISIAAGTILYLIARREGRRSGFDYKRQLLKDWIDD